MENRKQDPVLDALYKVRMYLSDQKDEEYEDKMAAWEAVRDFVVNNRMRGTEERPEVKNGMTLYDWAQQMGGTIDTDVFDSAVEAAANICFDCNEKPDDYYDRFMDKIVRNVEVVSDEAEYLVVSFSNYFKDHIQETKKFYKAAGIDPVEFSRSEIMYDMATLMESLCAGNASENTYKIFCEVFDEAKPQKENLNEKIEQKTKQVEKKINSEKDPLEIR